MAGEILVTDSTFLKSAYKQSSDENHTTVTYYGIGHVPAMFANGYNNWFGNDSFDMKLYYKLSNSASWQLTESYSFPNDSNYDHTIYAKDIHKHFIRWKALWTAVNGSGDDVAHFYGRLTVYSSQKDGIGTGRYLRLCANFGVGTSDVSPAFTQNTQLTTAHNILATDNLIDYPS
jgi:hypothetical protein